MHGTNCIALEVTGDLLEEVFEELRVGLVDHLHEVAGVSSKLSLHFIQLALEGVHRSAISTHDAVNTCHSYSYGNYYC